MDWRDVDPTQSKVAGVGVGYVIAARAGAVEIGWSLGRESQEDSLVVFLSVGKALSPDQDMQRRILRPLPRSVALRPGQAVLLAACWGGALVSGIAQAWNFRFYMNPDGISYLEIGEAFWRFDLADAISGYWSPLYAIVLGLVDAIADPSPAWEFQVVHLANLFVYLLALAAFNLLLFGLMDRNRRLGRKAGQARGIPAWAWLTIGHILFVWVTCQYTTAKLVTNDLLSLALLMTVAALFVRLEGRRVGALGALLLGGAVGLAYLNKLAALLPGLMFVAGLAVVDRRHGGFRRTLGLGLLGCGLVAAPFVGALSIQKGRFTLGDKGRLAYAWMVNDVEWFTHWQGGLPESGTALHPTRKLADRPAVFEFATPVAGTYPPWYDPSYWHEGVTVRFDWRQQWLRIRTQTWPQTRRLFSGRSTLLILGGLAAVLTLSLLLGRARIGRQACWAQIALAVPALTGMLMYVPVVMHRRFFGGFLLLLSLLTLAAVRLPEPRRRRLALLASLGLFVGLGTTAVAPLVWREVGRAVTDLRQHAVGDLSSHRHLRVAELLAAEGLAEGDHIAHIGPSSYAYWARLARLRIVAEIPYVRDDRWKADYAREFQLLDEERRSEILEALASAGVKAIVATNMPRRAGSGGGSREPTSDWRQDWKKIVDSREGLFAWSTVQEDGSVYLYTVERALAGRRELPDGSSPGA